MSNHDRFIIAMFEIFLDKLEFSYFFRLYEVFLLNLLVSCLHNIYFNPMNSNWDITNSVLAIIVLTLICNTEIIY